ncbi:Peptidylprolyl isomerase [Lentibacillus sp. JNUCC-1]|uniref:peptidylprolyl isomerase n=1 Tax=Lentibacillus sp. JNUCC-1 TaxID=2654513 RepID=UPI0012E85D51|nr:peptidylprolyl isomerase [Lentibacillus sp. JNUCC-1]MUV38045.1 Peptidylprolyl isomerase [Lentibacillus sp. JNUCC-1]
MSKKFLFSLIIVLLITNIATIILLGDGDDETTVLPDKEENIDVEKPAATINGENISYEAWMKSLRSEYGQMQLKQMIDHTLVEQLAEEKNIEISEKIIDRELAQLVSIGGVMSAEETKKWKEKWREDIIYRFQLETLLTEGVSIPEEEIQSFYDKYKNQYDFSERFQISHIIVKDLATAEKVKAELDEGASFNLLAKEYSIDEETREDGGYLGYFVSTSQFIPHGYKDIVQDMEPYSYSDPVEIGKRVAIVYVHQTLPEISFTYEEMKPYVKNELALDQMDQNLNAQPLWNNADIEWVYED